MEKQSHIERCPHVTALLQDEIGQLHAVDLQSQEASFSEVAGVSRDRLDKAEYQMESGLSMTTNNICLIRLRMQ